MRAIAIFSAVALATLVFAAPLAYAHRHACERGNQENILFRSEDVSVELEGGSILYSHAHNESTVEITQAHELIVDGRAVRLNRTQQRLVEDYYDTFQSIVDQGKEIGIEAAKVGAEGARLGLAAAAGALKLLSSDYDSDDLDRDMGCKKARLEHKAERLEERAARLKRDAHDLRDMHEQLRCDIKELNDLGWF
ncbi:MAG: DUF2884 family protein [Candidatus Krumholzibacteriaceae bacterium]|jgi:chaperonin cofactor prefoldin